MYILLVFVRVVGMYVGAGSNARAKTFGSILRFDDVSLCKVNGSQHGRFGDGK